MFLSCHRRFLPPSIIVDSLSTLYSPNCLAHSRDHVAPPQQPPGIALQADVVDKEWDKKAATTARKFRTGILPQVAEYPHLQKLLTPVQALLADEITAAGDLIMASNELKELDDETYCDCEFFRKYQLTCRDIWAQHQLFGTLKEEDFDRWAFMWEDSGFEPYEGITSEYYERGIDGEIEAPARRRLRPLPVHYGLWA